MLLNILKKDTRNVTLFQTFKKQLCRTIFSASEGAQGEGAEEEGGEPVAYLGGGGEGGLRGSIKWLKMFYSEMVILNSF